MRGANSADREAHREIVARAIMAFSFPGQMLVFRNSQLVCQPMPLLHGIGRRPHFQKTPRTSVRGVLADSPNSRLDVLGGRHFEAVAIGVLQQGVRFLGVIADMTLRLGIVT